MVHRTTHLFVNKKLVKEHGTQLAMFMAAVQHIFADAIEQKQSHASEPETFPAPKKPVSPDLFVPITNDELQELTGMSNYLLTNCKKEAVRLGWLDIEKRGIPAKQHYRVNHTG